MNFAVSSFNALIAAVIGCGLWYPVYGAALCAGTLPGGIAQARLFIKERGWKKHPILHVVGALAICSVVVLSIPMIAAGVLYRGRQSIEFLMVPRFDAMLQRELIARMPGTVKTAPKSYTFAQSIDIFMTAQSVGPSIAELQECGAMTLRCGCSVSPVAVSGNDTLAGAWRINIDDAPISGFDADFLEIEFDVQKRHYGSGLREKARSIKAAIEWMRSHDAGVPIHILRNKQNYGLGGSHKVAFHYAINGGYDKLVVLHGDDQGHIADALPLIADGGNGSIQPLERPLTDRGVYWRERFCDNLMFDYCMMMAFAYRKMRVRYFSMEWSESDQRSNVKMMSQATKTLAMLALCWRIM